MLQHMFSLTCNFAEGTVREEAVSIIGELLLNWNNFGYCLKGADAHGQL